MRHHGQLRRWLFRPVSDAGGLNPETLDEIRHTRLVFKDHTITDDQEKDPRLRPDNDFDFTDRSGSSSLRFIKIGCKGLSELTARALPKMPPTVFMPCVKISSDFAFRVTG